jgi:hypothetical protein
MTTSQKHTDDNESTVELALTAESSRMASTVVKRKLRFSLESNQVFPIKHFTDMSQNTMRKTWYTEEDYAIEFQNETCPVLHQIDRGDKMPESNTLTVRGLESRTHQGSLRHEHNKLMARVAVLNEQYRQFLDGEQDDELLADAYLNVSIRCGHEAHSMGLKDEAAIKKEPKEIIMTEQQKYVKHDDEPAIFPASTTESSRMASTVNKRTIRFSLKSNQVFSIPHINDMNQHDIHETWYTEAESKNIHNEICRAIRQIGKGDNVTETDSLTVRGIECRTQQGTLRRKHNRNMARNAVLNEQYRQYLNGEWDDGLVADASLRVSSHCHCEAYWMGFKDEAAIKKLKNSSRTENPKYVKADNESTIKRASIGKEPNETSMRIRRKMNNRGGKKDLRGIKGLLVRQARLPSLQKLFKKVSVRSAA